MTAQGWKAPERKPGEPWRPPADMADRVQNATAPAKADATRRSAARMSALQILHRDRGSGARAGILRTAHGEVRTPAFVPLATKGTVKGLEPREVAALGYDMVLGNTFHLMLDPGAELVEHFGGLHEFMGWRSPIITDSGGFQVFSMGHGTVADEIKGRAPAGPNRLGRVLSIDEDGVRFRSWIDGSEKFMGPETSMEVQATLGSDIALVFDECTPFNVDRDYTARSTERSHRWLDRCLQWHAQHGPHGPARLRDHPGRRPRGPADRLGAADRRAAGRRDRDRRLARRRQAADVRGRRLGDLGHRRRPPAPPARHRRRRRPHPRRRARRRHVRLRDADAAGPSRRRARPRARCALARRPHRRALEALARADHGGLPVPVVRGAASRAATCATCSSSASSPRCAC